MKGRAGSREGSRQWEQHVARHIRGTQRRPDARSRQGQGAGTRHHWQGGQGQSKEGPPASRRSASLAWGWHASSEMVLRKRAGEQNAASQSALNPSSGLTAVRGVSAQGLSTGALYNLSPHCSLRGQHMAVVTSKDP